MSRMRNRIHESNQVIISSISSGRLQEISDETEDTAEAEAGGDLLGTAGEGRWGGRGLGDG